jgi:hypothetical protein
VELDGEWEVALVEIAYPVSWHNLSEGEYFQLIDRVNNKAVTEPIRVPEGRYESPIRLVDAMRTAWRDYWEEREQPDQASIVLIVPRSADDASVTSMSIRFDEKTNKVKFKLADVNHSLRLSPILSDILTIWSNSWTVFTGQRYAIGGKTYESETRIDLDRGMHTFFIYCDIVRDSIVGDVRAPLLRAVSARGVHGLTTRESFSRPQYIPLRTNIFDTVQISIKTEDGRPAPFIFGNAYVTLHFRRVLF